MFEERRGRYSLENNAGVEKNDGESVEASIRKAVERVAEVFRIIEEQHGKTFEEVIQFLEDHGYSAREILINQQERIDSDIYGRILAHTVSLEEVDKWLSEVSEWEREVCQLAATFVSMYEQCRDHSSVCC